MIYNNLILPIHTYMNLYIPGPSIRNALKKDGLKNVRIETEKEGNGNGRSFSRNDG